MVGRSARIAIIGAGLAGLACARQLTKQGVSITIFDKGRGLGGRLSTRRGDGVQFDHGAQYLTAESEAFQAVLREAERAGAVARWGGGDVDAFVGVPGMTGLAKHLAHGLTVRQNVRVTGVSQVGPAWQLAWEDGAETFDHVVLTIPAPQTKMLLGDHQLFNEALDRVRMHPCIALMLALPERETPDFETMREPDGPIAWLAHDSSKPGRPDARCLVAHASAAWSRAHLEEDMTTVAHAMLPLVAEMIGQRLPRDLPYLTAHRWRYALVADPLGKPFLSNGTGSLYVGGDWCIGPRAEDAWTSGTAIGAHLAGQLR